MGDLLGPGGRGEELESAAPAWGADLGAPATPRQEAEALRLAAEMGAAAGRFGVGWAALQPEGRGRLDPAALARLDRRIDAIGEAGLAPWPMLAPADLPRDIRIRGGWTARDTAWRFAEFACRIADRIGDRMAALVVDAGAPGFAWTEAAWRDRPVGMAEDAAFRAALHHLLLGRGLALAALRQESGRWRLGAALASPPPEPWDDTLASSDAVAIAEALGWEASIATLRDGRYPELAAERLGRLVEEGDAARCRAPVDLLLLDHAGPLWARMDSAAPGGVDLADRPRGGAMPEAAGPQSLRQALDRLARAWPKLPVHLTLRIAADDPPLREGRIEDGARIEALEATLEAVEAASASGVPLATVFLGPVLDDGAAPPAGLAAWDARTDVPQPKESWRRLQRRIRG
ncbi:family 1 glycosylhydrolase [Inquilinus limosus]|uniref:family 1 glycosylhydrolase n=1 Tax=Inquilinus limosus TaxID=171674 RepID=UPI003F188E26